MRKRTQTAGEITLDVTDFGEGLVWLFFLDLKGRCGVSLSDGSGELSGRSHKVLVWRGYSPGGRADDEAVAADFG